MGQGSSTPTNEVTSAGDLQEATEKGGLHIIEFHSSSAGLGVLSLIAILLLLCTTYLLRLKFCQKKRQRQGVSVTLNGGSQKSSPSAPTQNQTTIAHQPSTAPNPIPIPDPRLDGALNSFTEQIRYRPSDDHRILLPLPTPTATSSQKSKTPHLHPSADTRKSWSVDQFPPPDPAIALLEKRLNDTIDQANAFIHQQSLTSHRKGNTMPATSTWDAILQPYTPSPHTR